MTGTVWTKACGSSSYIEVTEVIGLVRIRTAASKAFGTDVIATDDEWWQFLDGVKAGAFDHVVPRP